MLAGDKTAEQICHQYGISPNYNDSLLPADLDSPTPPPSGEDQFAIGSVGDIDNSHLSLYSVHINNPGDWTQGATFTGDNDDQLISIATFSPACWQLRWRLRSAKGNHRQGRLSGRSADVSFRVLERR